MVATAPAVRRALAGALLALGVLAAALFAWLGRDGAAVGGPRGFEPTPPTAVVREPVHLEAQAPAERPEPAPEPTAEPLTSPAEPEPHARRPAGEPGPARTGSLRVDADLRDARLWVGSGGSLPLDAPSFPASASLAGGFVRDCGVSGPGDWSVHALPPGPLRVLVADATGRRIEFDGLWVLAGETLLVVGPEPSTRTLTLRVLAPGGAPLVGARVALACDRPGGARDALGAGAASSLGATGVDGVALVTPRVGAWRLLVTAPGLAPYVLDGTSWPEDEPRVIEIEMAPGGEIAGDVLDPDALGFAGRRIAAWSAVGPGPAPSVARELGLPVDALATVAGADVTPEGRFAFRGLSGGTVLELRALVDSDLAHSDAFAPLALARAGERGVLVTQRAGAVLELEVLDAGSLAPIASFTAELAATWPGGAHRGRDGKLLWSGLRPFEAAADPTFEDLPESPDLELSVSADGYDLARPPTLRLRTGESARPPRILLRPLPAVHVRLVDALDGRPIEGARCELAALSPELAVGRAASADVSDAAGRARLTATANNAAELFVRCSGYAPLRLRTPAPNSHEQPLEVALVPGASVRARVVDAEGNPVRALVLRRRTSIETGDALAVEHERALTDAEGWAEFRDLEAGPVALAACELARSDLELPPPAGRMSWVSVGVGPGGAAELELGALPATEIDLELRWQGRELPGAVLRLAGDTAAFSAPHDDVRTFLTGPALRADAKGLVRLGALHGGLYALRVEHPLVPGFARALLAVGGADGLRTLELASERLRGEVVRDGELAEESRVVVWAHGPFYERGLEVGPGSVLRELAPEPIFLGETELANGAFDLPVPAGVELLVTASNGVASGDYYVAVPEGPREPIAVTIEPSMELQLAADLRGKRTPTRALGVVGYNLHQPWGRGLIALPIERNHLSLADLPPGTWRLCLVELAGGQLVLERGDWSEYELPGGPAGVRLSWRRS